MSRWTWCALLWLAGCHLARAEGGRPPGTRAARAEPVGEILYQQGLAPHWIDSGWAPRQLQAGQPAKIDFSQQQGWIVANPQLAGRFSAVRFRLKSPPSRGDFLAVHLDSLREEVFPTIRIGPQHRHDLDGDWTEVRVSLAELNPDGRAFDRVVLVGLPHPGAGSALIDDLVLSAGEPTSPGFEAISQPARPAERLKVACSPTDAAINPMIYGIAVRAGAEAADAYLWGLGATARRWGGNPTSTYNWKLGNAWSTGSDWFFQNVQVSKDPSYTYQRVLDDDVAAGIKTALTVPLLGWVAKDTHSSAFPISVFGLQAAQDPYSEAGNGVTKEGVPIDSGPPAGTSLPAPPAFVGDWVRQIRRDDAHRGGRSVALYLLDNEPALWNSTHRDLHPQPVSYDELLRRTLDYGSEVRRADPQATIAGPAEWGWPAYFYSAVDAATKFKLNPDRLAHGNMPLLPWYLSKLAAHQQETGERILDLLDVHYYPQADGVAGAQGRTDPKTSALRLRSTRSLWDPNYRDESWIDDKVALIPRLKGWIADNYPGLGVAIGEWNFGAEGHISGGLAVAEVLGRFGQQGVSAAFYWTYPPDRSPAFWAFRAFRNFDGHGGHFLERAVRTTEADGLSLFASRNEGQDHLVVIALNLDPAKSRAAVLNFDGCGQPKSGQTYGFSARAPELTPGPPVKIAEGAVEATLEPYSLTVFDLQLAK